MENNKIKFDNRVLKNRILNKYGSIKNAAEAFGMRPDTLSRKLNSKSYFTFEEIQKIVEIMEIDRLDVDRCFFTEEDDDLRLCTKTLMILAKELTEGERKTLIKILDLTTGRPDRRVMAKNWTGKMADLPAALAQI